MGPFSRLFRVPKPQRFFFITSLSTGASLITLSLLINKLSGLYGILALVTGYELSSFQLSMYIYSITALALTIYLTPHIKSQTPLYCMALAWFYVLDSIINAMYTAAFGATWFLVLISHGKGETATKGPGAGMVGDTSGFTSPAQNVSEVEINISGTQASGNSPVNNGVPSDTAAGVGDGSALIWGRESINSVGVIVSLWTMRAYFCVVMLAWARMVLRTYIASMQARNPMTDFTATVGGDGMVANPFDANKPDGRGWGGKFGRIFISLGRRYWLGTDEDQSWMNAASSKLQTQASRRQGSAASNDTVPLATINKERESRRRSGTGPPLPSVQAAAGVVSEGEETEDSRKLLTVPPKTNV